MVKGNRRSMTAMFNSAVASRTEETIESLKAEIAALKTSNAKNQAENVSIQIPVKDIVPLQLPDNLKQPRRYFSESALAKLKDSIARHEVLEPILLRTGKNHPFEIVSGERRWRCSKELGKETIPGVVREMDDTVALEAALIAHLMSENISALEETDSILGLLSLKLNQDLDAIPPLLIKISNAQQRGNEDVLDALKESVVTVEGVLDSFKLKINSFTQNRLPLLNLGDEILEAVREGRLSPTNAKLINKEEPYLHQELIQDAVGLSKDSLKELIRTKTSRNNSDSPTGTTSVSLTLLDRMKRLQKAKTLKRIQSSQEAQGKLAQVDKLLREIESLLHL